MAPSTDLDTLAPSVVQTVSQPKTPEPPLASPQAPKRSGPSAKLAVIGLGATILAAAVFYLVLGKHLVKITVDDPSISLKVDGEDVLIQGEETKIRLSAGKHDLLVKYDGLEAETDTFTVKRAGKTAVHVAIVDGRLLIEQGQDGQVRPRPKTKKMEVAGGAATQSGATDASTMLGLHFGDESDEVVVPSLMDTTDALTIELWLQRDVSHLAAHSLLVGFDTKTTLYTDATASLAFISDTFSATDPTAVRSNMHLSKGVEGPAHIAGVRDPMKKESRIYVDGQPAAEKMERLVRGQHCLKFGSNSGQWQPESGGDDHSFSGWITAVRISKSARYSERFQPSRNPIADEDTVALYLCNEGSGKILKDSSGNNHHGQIKGAKWERFPIDPLSHVTRNGTEHDPADWSEDLAEAREDAEPALERALIPKGLKPGDRYQLIFVTSVKRDGTSAKIADYNAFVNSVADRAEMGPTKSQNSPAGPIQWRALCSTTNVAARDNCKVEAPVYNVMSQRVASPAVFWSRNHENPVMYTEFGRKHEHAALTGSNESGQPSNPLGGGMVWIGHPHEQGNGIWIAGNKLASQVPLGMYAISEVLTVPSNANNQ